MFRRYWWLLTIAAIAVIALALLPFASELPDGLEQVAEMFGFAERERKVYNAPMQDYSLPLFSEFWGQAIAALIGILVVSGLTLLIGKSLRRVSRP